MRVSITALIALACLAAAARAETAWTAARAGDVEFSARLVLDLNQIERMLGDRLDESYTLVELKVRPLFDNMLELDRSDFVFRCRCDNEHSEAQSPSRIAGSAVLALDQKVQGGGGIFARQNDPLLVGGVPGTGTRPRRIGNTPSGIGSGGMSRVETEIRAEVSEDDTLLGHLKRLELPLEPIDEPISGYLYFQVNPKRKLKRYVLSYDGVYGEFQMQFTK